ncbi:hypothetical protein JB92DRAFT_3031616 [Gautieria morchelliformis]|nr:hypothetical protein JB92DRAFT_3031616 [Gautieria morchelliformis]
MRYDMGIMVRLFGRRVRLPFCDYLGSRFWILAFWTCASHFDGTSEVRCMGDCFLRYVIKHARSRS